MQDYHPDWLDFDIEETPRYSSAEWQRTLIDFLKTYHGPEQIKAYLDRKIYKQDEAKWYAAQLLFEKVNGLVNHYHLPKTNMLFYGPTGCGKTYIFEVLSEISPIPIVIIDTTKITEEGFKGNDAADVLCPLKRQYDNMEHGIIVLDEFDKIVQPSYSSRGTDVHAMIQTTLLKIFEGCLLQKERGIALDTSDISFICLGAFSEDYMEAYVNRKPIGFQKHKEAPRRERITEKMMQMGMLRELAGRLQTVIGLEALTKDDYIKILTEVEGNALHDIRETFRLNYHIHINLTDDAIDELADSAFRQQLGARGLSGILNRTCRMNLMVARRNKQKILNVTADLIREADMLNSYFNKKDREKVC